MPDPSIDIPVAEASQSMGWRPGRRGALTISPTNHDSGAGQYSVTATPVSQRPLACLLGGEGVWTGALDPGASPPPRSPTPPGPGGAGAAEPSAAPPPAAPRAGRAA